MDATKLLNIICENKSELYVKQNKICKPLQKYWKSGWWSKECNFQDVFSTIRLQLCRFVSTILLLDFCFKIFSTAFLYCLSFLSFSFCLSFYIFLLLVFSLFRFHFCFFWYTLVFFSLFFAKRRGNQIEFEVDSFQQQTHLPFMLPNWEKDEKNL